MLANFLTHRYGEIRTAGRNNLIKIIKVINIQAIIIIQLKYYIPEYTRMLEYRYIKENSQK